MKYQYDINGFSNKYKKQKSKIPTQNDKKQEWYKKPFEFTSEQKKVSGEPAQKKPKLDAIPQFICNDCQKLKSSFSNMEKQLNLKTAECRKLHSDFDSQKESFSSFRDSTQSKIKDLENQLIDLQKNTMIYKKNTMI